MCDCAKKQGLHVDKQRVIAGALLHDIGRSITQDIRHATVGADLLRRDGWDERVVLMVERHTGAGIDLAEATALGLPARDYTPQTLEEKIVAHADNLFSGERRITLGQLETKYLAKGLPMAWQKIANLHEKLQETLGVDLQALQPIRLTLLD